MADIPRKIDLHMHSTVSDGTDTPEQLLQNVIAAGIGVFSVTDHDAVKAAHVLRDLIGEGDPIFIPGVEVSSAMGLTPLTRPSQGWWSSATNFA